MSSSRKNKCGRHPFYRTPEEMQEKIDRYFEECKGEVLVIEGSPVFDKYGQPIIINARPPTITGLAFALGFVSRQSLIDYAEKKAFTDTVCAQSSRLRHTTKPGSLIVMVRVVPSSTSSIISAGLTSQTFPPPQSPRALSSSPG